ncbi:hypothetical protein SCLCIDRAFT_1222129 [Scleroderma citrinum Foug A]|uniref:Uncharacterized protein n=1 Tax=Scleroderma citrinum Foug A TaxID=1036808 RepID=A0A0C3D0G8_9AGAM|nr:hypothetical protein SCLCIDRAFT_1222129 [Scleroderma citrinum Foug A]
MDVPSIGHFHSISDDILVVRGLFHSEEHSKSAPYQKPVSDYVPGTCVLTPTP